VSAAVTQSPADDAQVLLTVDQVADMAGVTVSRVRLWIAQGKLVAVKRRGRRKLYARGAVEGLLLVVCPLCGQAFVRSNLRQAYCTPRCRSAAHRLGLSRRPATPQEPGNPPAPDPAPVPDPSRPGHGGDGPALDNGTKPGEPDLDISLRVRMELERSRREREQRAAQRRAGGTLPPPPPELWE